MIRLLKYITKKLEAFKCWVHINWNNTLEKLKSKCICENLPS